MIMLPLKKILCPTDFSEPSRRAIAAASELAVHFSAELLLVHVINPIHLIPPSSSSLVFLDNSYWDEIEAAARKRLDELVGEIAPGNLLVRTFVIHGNPAEEIVRIAEQEGADVIVIATHGMTGWRHLLFGSVAERVMRLAACTVLLSKSPEERHGRAENVA
jgi:nucleotide-binding universal stress UspA family protein